MTSDTKKFLLIVVAFHPPEELVLRLEEVLLAGFDLAIYDNSPTGAQLLKPLYERCIWYVATAENKGLGTGMHQLLNAAQKAGYQWAVYMDQDTRFSTQSLQWMQTQLQNKADFWVQTAAVQFKGVVGTKAAHLQSQDLLINSGTAFYLPNLLKWGGPDPAFFVECVDYKCSLDVAHQGLQLWQWTGCPDFDHDSLQPLVQYQWQARHFNYRPYPWQRHRAFLVALLRLVGLAIQRKQYRYARLFFRNVFTHLLTQIQAAVLYSASKLGVVKKNCSFVIVIFNTLIL